MRKSDKNIVCFSHGRDSGPWGKKIKTLAQIAHANNFAVESIDYRGIFDPDMRVQKLVDTMSEYNNLVLVGSSMGAYVATVSSDRLNPEGLFLLAPALYLPGYQKQNPVPNAKLTWIVHGWNDDLIPLKNIINFAQKHKAHLSILNSDHGLTSVLPFIEDLFNLFLQKINSINK